MTGCCDAARVIASMCCNAGCVPRCAAVTSHRCGGAGRYDCASTAVSSRCGIAAGRYGTSSSFVFSGESSLTSRIRECYMKLKRRRIYILHGDGRRSQRRRSRNLSCSGSLKYSITLTGKIPVLLTWLLLKLAHRGNGKLALCPKSMTARASSCKPSNLYASLSPHRLEKPWTPQPVHLCFSKKRSDVEQVSQVLLSSLST